MNFQRATKRLLGLFITLLVLDLFGIMRPVKDETLPELAAFVAAEVTQISLSQGDVRIVLERTGQRTFSLVSPISQPADFGRVNAITSTLYAPTFCVTIALLELGPLRACLRSARSATFSRASFR